MYKVEEDSGKEPAGSYDSLNDSDDPIDSSNDLKICSEYGSGEPIDLESLKSRIKHPRYVCGSCGRSASDKFGLCSPENL